MSYELNKKISDKAWELKRKIHYELDTIISNSGHMDYKRNFISCGESIEQLGREMAKVMKDFKPEEYEK